MKARAAATSFLLCLYAQSASSHFDKRVEKKKAPGLPQGTWKTNSEIRKKKIEDWTLSNPKKEFDTRL